MRTHLGCPNFVANDSYHVGISHIFQMNRNFSSLHKRRTENRKINEFSYM